MADLPFTKMHGAGNDFVIIDNRSNALTRERIIELAPELCHRRFGIGADGIIAMLPPEKSGVDYTMFYRNADGSDAGMCGNGARCLALFAAETGLGTQLSFNVHDTEYQALVDPAGQYVALAFPMQIDVGKIALDNQPKIYQLHAGTEHIVMEISEEELADDPRLIKKGKALRYHDRFNPPGTNVNFISGLTREEIKIKTYERGVENLTLACGTGAIAGALAWHHINRDNNPEETINVQAEGGTLKVHFSYNSDEATYSDIQLSGKAKFVFKGIYAI